MIGSSCFTLISTNSNSPVVSARGRLYAGVEVLSPTIKYTLPKIRGRTVNRLCGWTAFSRAGFEDLFYDESHTVVMGTAYVVVLRRIGAVRPLTCETDCGCGIPR